MVSVVSTERYPRFDCYIRQIGAHDVRGPGRGKAHTPSPKSGTTVQSKRLQLPSRLYVTMTSYTKTAMHAVIT